MSNQNPKLAVLQEIMDMMDHQMLGKVPKKGAMPPAAMTALPPEGAPGHEAMEPGAEATQEHDTIDPEILAQLLKLHDKGDEERITPPGNISGSF